MDQLIHLQDGFRFRFRNHGALARQCGPLAHRLRVADRQPQSGQPGLLRGGFRRSPPCPHRAVFHHAGSHFLSDPATFMRDSMETRHRNMSAFQADNVTCGFKVRNVETGATEDFLNPFSNTFVALFEVFQTLYYVQEGAMLCPAVACSPIRATTRRPRSRSACMKTRSASWSRSGSGFRTTTASCSSRPSATSMPMTTAPRKRRTA